MEIDNLKSVWQEMSTPEKDKETLNLMLKKNTYPVLSAIKKQLTAELLGFSLFLACYFSMFDGADKPLAINSIMMVCLFVQLFYGYKGYLIQRGFKSSANLCQDLENLSSRLKSYRLGVVVARFLFAIGLITFFTYNINFSGGKLWALGAIVVVFSIQLLFLYRIWTKRIERLTSAVHEFRASVD